MSRPMRRLARRPMKPAMRKIHKTITRDGAQTTASDFFPPGKKGVMAAAYKNPGTA